MIARFLKVAKPPPATTPERARLREALEAVPHAEHALKAAGEHVERLLDAIAAANDADVAAKQAEQSDADSMADWFAAGSVGPAPTSNATVSARARAAEARVAAKGAEQALPAVREREAEARRALEDARDAAHSAKLGVILNELIEPRLAVAEQSGSVMNGALELLWPILFALQHFSACHAPTMAERLLRRIEALAPRAPPRSVDATTAYVYRGQNAALLDPICSFAERLGEDPEAQF